MRKGQALTSWKKKKKGHRTRKAVSTISRKRGGPCSLGGKRKKKKYRRGDERERSVNETA